MRVASDNPGSTVLADSSVVAIGNFDGVHLGHRELLRCCCESAGEGDSVVLLTFEPLPQAWFRPDSAPARLTSVHQKLKLVEDLGVDLVWSMRFNQQFADMAAHDFVHSVLVEDLGARVVIVGEDFRFGKDRQGDVALLRQLGAEYGFETRVVPAVVRQGQRVSSTAIRTALAEGKLDLAKVLLGRAFRMEGEVAHGAKLGRKLGYPTANIRLEAEPCPLQGVFAVRARVEGEQWRGGVVSLGRRPAMGGGEFLLEVHLFDFDGDLYGCRMEVEFVEKLRDELNFDGVEALMSQMNMDEKQAREILGETHIG
jgi:riboflavin kinase/FMN adenylyltransferase